MVEENAIPDSLEVVKEIEFGKGGDIQLHAEIIRPKISSETPLPAIVWIHGGGWRKHHRGNISKRVALALRGYCVVSIQYRTIDEGIWPAQIEDCKHAVRWLRANAKKYHIHPDYIGAWGSSAGGHLAACLGTMDENAGFDKSGDYQDVSSRVQAVVDFCGPTLFSSSLAQVQVELFQGKLEDKPDLWASARPIPRVSSNTPPFMVVHGDSDKTVQLVNSERLVDALKKAGVPTKFLIVKGGGHNFKGTPDVPATPSREEIFQMVADFFDEHIKSKISAAR
jgi:acetyl esterase/lipase